VYNNGIPDVTCQVSIHSHFVLHSTS
jgi:hypothetical protein